MDACKGKCKLINGMGEERTLMEKVILPTFYNIMKNVL